MQMQRFNVTVHHKPYQKKPGQVEVASHIRRLSENQIQHVNIYELAAILGRGQSVVLGVHDLNHGEKRPFCIKKCSVLTLTMETSRLKNLNNG